MSDLVTHDDASSGGIPNGGGDGVDHGDRLPGHEAVIRRVVWAMPQLTEVRADQVSAVVHRRDDRLVAIVGIPARFAGNVTAPLVQRTRQALLAYDSTVRSVDISVVELG